MPTTGRNRPDLIVVMTDQHRADVCGREGFPLDTTPFLDELAGRGAWFNRAYTSSPLCCPARTSLLTGRYPSAHRVTQNPAMRQAVFDTHLFRVAREMGYATALIGKNHSFITEDDVDCYIEFSHGGQVTGKRTDEEEEFDSWLTDLRHRTYHEPAPFPARLQNPPRIVDHALEWISGVPADQPLLLFLSFPEPHNPYQVPEPYHSLFPVAELPPTLTSQTALGDLPFSWRYLRMLGERGEHDYEGTIPRARANYFGMLRLLDDELRRFCTGVETRRDRHGRVTVVTADHGDYVGEYGLVRKGAEIPEILARIPMVIAGSGVRAGSGPHRAHVSITDVFPTLCEIIGHEIPAGAQGRSLWPLLSGEPYPEEEFSSAYVEQGMGGIPYAPRDVPDAPGSMPGLFDDGPAGSPRFDELNAVTQSGRRRRIRSGDWSLVADVLGAARLYNVAEDPLELHDRWSEPGLDAVRADLLRKLAVWQMRAEDPLPAVPRGYALKRDPRNYLAPYAEPGR